MRHLSVIAGLALAVFASGLAAAQDAPDRDCTLSDIDAALSGSYSGPGCRFTIEPSPGMTPEGRPVVLPDSFFRGPGAGGVERQAGPVFLYRGMILVSSAGGVRVATLPVSGGMIRYQDGVGASVPVTAPVIAPRRAYPGR